MVIKVLMLGNGFDLSYKFPTNYLSFIKTIKYIVDNKTSEFKTVGDVYKNLRFIRDIYQKYGSEYEECEIDKEKLDKIVSLARDNCWYSYFCEYITDDIKWIDFESEIKKVIECFNNFFETAKRRNRLKYIGNNNTYEYIVASTLSKFDEVFLSKDSSSAKVISLKPAWVNKDIISCVESIDKKKIVKYLYNNLNDFSEMLKTYLQVFVETPLKLLNNNGKLQSYDYMIDYNYIVTFNYTKTYEVVYNGKNTSGDVRLEDRVFHIHGIIDDKIILGINPGSEDNADSVDTSFVGFKKYYQRVAYNTDVSFIKKMRKFKTSSFAKNNSVHLCVFGHSLDETDKDVIIELFGIAKEITIMCRNNRSMYNYIEKIIGIYGKEGLDKLRTEKKLTFEVVPKEQTEVTTP